MKGEKGVRGPKGEQGLRGERGEIGPVPTEVSIISFLEGCCCGILNFFNTK